MNYEVKLILTIFSRILGNSCSLRSKRFRLVSKKTEKRDERGEGEGGGGGEGRGGGGRKEGNFTTPSPLTRAIFRTDFDIFSEIARKCLLRRLEFPSTITINRFSYLFI